MVRVAEKTQAEFMKGLNKEFMKVMKGLESAYKVATITMWGSISVIIIGIAGTVFLLVANK